MACGQLQTSLQPAYSTASYRQRRAASDRRHCSWRVAQPATDTGVRPATDAVAAGVQHNQLQTMAYGQLQTPLQPACSTASYIQWRAASYRRHCSRRIAQPATDNGVWSVTDAINCTWRVVSYRRHCSWRIAQPMACGSWLLIVAGDAITPAIAIN